MNNRQSGIGLIGLLIIIVIIVIILSYLGINLRGVVEEVVKPFWATILAKLNL